MTREDKIEFLMEVLSIIMIPTFDNAANTLCLFKIMLLTYEEDVITKIYNDVKSLVGSENGGSKNEN